MSRPTRRHGEPGPVDVAAWLGDDPHLALVNADLGEWLAAHPCHCEDLCRCDEQEAQQRA